MINVTKPKIHNKKKLYYYFDKIINSGQFTNEGDIHKKLHSELLKKFNFKYIQLVANGNLALQMAIKSLHIKGDVITTPFSYVATTNSILWEGCNPIFVDIDKKTLCIDPNLIEQAITKKTSAILATHVFGNACNVNIISKIAKKYKLKVIYDGAHSFGVSYKGKPLLNYGDCSIVSFHATKLFNTAEGGAIVTSKKIINNDIEYLKRFGHYGEEDYKMVGINAKLSEFHAALGLTNLPYLEKEIEKRKKISHLYDKYFFDFNIIRPEFDKDIKRNYSYYPVIFSSKNEREEVRKYLIENNIISRRYFWPSLNKLPFLHKNLQKKCPVSENTADRILCLPIYYDLKLKEVKKIALTILQYMKK